MASTYSTNLKIQLIGTGEQSGVWGNTTNTNWGLIEQAVAGVQTITMSNADYTLTNLNGVLDESRNMVLVVGGTNSAIRKVIAPANQTKFYVVSNQTSGGYAITVGYLTGLYITIPPGVTAQVYGDGTNFYSAQTGSAGDFLVNGNLVVSNNETIAGTLGVAGAITGSTASFSGAISSVSPAFTGTPTAPTAAAGTNSTQIATTAFVTQNAVLSGTVQMWPTASAPTGYLLCDGAAVSRSTYAALFAVVGTTFGVGDGSTTFNLPDYRGRSPLGVSGSYALASTGGSADAVVVSHTHTASVTDPGHNHVYTRQYSNGGYAAGGGAQNTQIDTATSTATTGISVGISTTGSSGTGANLQPYLAINFIIKT